MDLFTPVVPEHEQHPNFARVAGTPAYAPERAVITQWADGFADRDGKLVKEFQTTFNSSFWELYLHACFQHEGYSADYTKDRPDFILSTPIGDIIAEATIASNPQGYRPEWERDFNDISQPVEDIEKLVTLSCIRLANAITEKHKKYVTSYSILPHVAGKPFVICVAPFEQPLFFLQNDQAIRRVLYGYDHPIYIDLPESEERLIVGDALIEYVVKETGSPIPLGFFASPMMKEVSAVVFSNTATLSKITALAPVVPDRKVIFVSLRYNDYGKEPYLIKALKEDYEESLLDGLHVFHNPCADIPLPPGFLDADDVAHHTFDVATGEYLVEISDGHLIQRMCQSFSFEKDLSTLPLPPSPSPSSAPTYKEYEPPKWDEGVLMLVKGDAGTWTQTHMAHYRGWTILVAFEKNDEDWGAQGRPGLHYTVSSYIRANHKSDEGMFVLNEYFDSKEAAMHAAMREIDGSID